MLSSNCVVFGSKKSRFDKEQEASGFSIRSLGVKSPRNSYIRKHYLME